MTTLSDIIAGAFTDTGQMIIETATGGSATTFVNTATRYTSDDALVGGTAIVLSTTDGLTPQGKFARISDFVASTKTFTIDTVTDVIAAGDKIGLCRPTISLNQMIRAANDGLKDHVGTISKVDISLTSVADEGVYTLPAGVWIKRLIDVQIGNATDGYSTIISKVEVQPTTTGASLLSHGLEAGQTIKVIYEGTHPTLSLYSDIVHESVPEALMRAATIEKAMGWLIHKRGDSAANTMLVQFQNEASQKIANFKQEMPVNRVRPQPRWFI